MFNREKLLEALNGYGYSNIVTKVKMLVTGVLLLHRLTLKS